MTITFLIPTIGRESLRRTLDSIELMPGDEILIVGEGLEISHPRARVLHCPRGNDWGHTERNFAMPYASGQYLAHIDDDDWYVPGARARMQEAMESAPGRPTIFQMQYPNGLVLWQTKELRCGNIGTPMMLFPNLPTRRGRWESYVGGDFAFLEGCGWTKEDFIWRQEVIVMLGHNV